MKRFVVTCFGLLLAIAAASPVRGQLDLKFDGSVNGAFLTAGNWSSITFPGPDILPPPGPDPVVTPVPAVPGGSDRANINDGFVVTYATGATTSVSSLIVGGDAPQMPGDFGSPGTLNLSDGKLNVTGGGDSFQISRACCMLAMVATLNMSGDAVLEINGSDPIVGTRDFGVLNVRDTAAVISIRTGPDPTVYWRLGNYGPSFDPGTIPGGLQGHGLLNVEDYGLVQSPCHLYWGQRLDWRVAGLRQRVGNFDRQLGCETIRILSAWGPPQFA